MTAFNLDDFTLRLIAEVFFYDEDYEALGNLSLIDPVAAKEQYIATYSPEDAVYVIEEATKWDEADAEDDGLDYALAIDSVEHGVYNTAEEAALVMLNLARKHALTPSITLLFPDEDAL